MAFINNKKYKEINEAANNGNEKAKMILQAMLKGNTQEDLDNLVNDYYNVVNDVPPIEQIEQMEEVVPQEVEQIPEVVDITDSLENEMKDLLDEKEIEELTFSDFLKNKRKDALRSKKNNDYFKAFDLEGRNKYVNDRKNAYNEKFNTSRRNIERNYNDINNALNKYSNDVNLMLDDEIELDINAANLAYNELTENDETMKSFGRHWDELDQQNMKEILQQLVIKYGKKNVIAVLNTLKGDNDNYSQYKTNQIDTEINRFSKNLVDLLK